MTKVCLGETPKVTHHKTNSMLNKVNKHICIRFCHQNIQCLSNKVLPLTVSVQNNFCDFLMITEHWQKSDQLKNIVINDYTLCAQFSRCSMKHGGVAIFKNKTFLHSVTAYDVEEFCIEGIFECACLRINNLNVIVIVIYRPPGGNFNDFLTLFDGLVARVFDPICKIIVGGDFNLNFLESSTSLSLFLDLISTYNLIHTVKRPTRVSARSSTYIDNFLISIDQSFAVSVADLCLADHYSQFLEIFTSTSKTDKIQRCAVKRVVSNENVAKLLNYLNEESWVDVFSGVCLTDAFESFATRLFYYYELCFPLVTFKINTNRQKFRKYNLTRELRDLREKVSMYNDLSKKDPKYKDVFKCLNNIYKEKLKLSFIAHNDKIVINSKNKSKAMWQIIHNLQKNNNSSREIIFSDKGVAVPNVAVANNFNQYFTDLPTCDNVDMDFIQECVPLCDRTFFLSPVCEQDVILFINSLKNSCASGHDGISNNLLKQCKYVLSNVLCFLINWSAVSGIFPNQLKLAKVAPIFKKGDKNQYENFRGISLLTSISKIFELNIKKQLLNFLNQNNILSKYQHGFTETRSTETALSEFHIKIVDAVDKSLHALGLFVDFSRAFDMVNHEILLFKLERYGIRGLTSQLFRSYLTNRQQYVVVNGTKSKRIVVNQGVPQGSVLGPLLYLIYSNDLLSHLQKVLPSVFFSSYADDTNIVIISKNRDLLRQQTELVYNSVLFWSEKNCLKLSQNKTNFIVFSNKKQDNSGLILFQNSSQPLASSTTSVMLGVKFDENLRWFDHIDDVSAKLRSNCYGLKSLSYYCSRGTLLSVYYATIHSHLSYGILNWGASSEAVRVFLLQKYAIRIICGLSPTMSCRDYFKELKVLTVTGLYIYKICIYAFNNKRNLQLNRAMHNHNTRNKELLLPSSHKTSFYQKNITFNACRFFNKLNNDIKSAQSLNIFKKKLKDELTVKSYYTFQEFLG